MKRGGWGLLLWVVVGCGARTFETRESGDSPSSLSDEELSGRIADEIDRLNSCRRASDCLEVNVAPCDVAYVNASADTQGLEGLLSELSSRVGPAVCGPCECGVLRCEAGTCVPRPGSCTSAPSGGRLVCL